MHYVAAGKGKGAGSDGDRGSKGIIDWPKKHTTKEFEFDTDNLGKDPNPEEEEEEPGDTGDDGEEGDEGY